MEQTNKIKTKTITGAFFLSLQPISAMILGFIIVYAISKNIAVEDLGIFSFLNMLYNWYTLIFILLIQGAIIKYIGEYKGRSDKQTVNNLVKTSTLYILIVTPTLAFIAFFVTEFIFDILNLEIKLITILIFCLATSSSIVVLVVSALGRGLQKLKEVGTISFFGSIVSQIITWVLINKGYGISSLVFRWLLANLIIIVLLLVSDKSLISLKGDLFPFRKLITFGLPIFITSMIAYVSQHSFLRIILKNYFSLTEVGYFEFGMRLSILVSTLAVGYRQVLTPYFATDYGYGGEQLVGKNLLWTVKFGSFVFSPLIVFSVIVGKIIFNITFKEYLPAYSFFAIFTLGLWPILLLGPFVSVLIAVGRPEKLLIARIISTILGVPLTFLFIRIGALGITIVWTFMDTVNSFLNFFFCRKYVQIHVDWKKTFMFLISAILPLPAVLILNYLLKDFYAIFTVTLTILVIYIVFVRAFGLITEREISTALAFLPEGLKRKIVRIVSKR